MAEAIPHVITNDEEYAVLLDLMQFCLKRKTKYEGAVLFKVTAEKKPPRDLIIRISNSKVSLAPDATPEWEQRCAETKEQPKRPEKTVQGVSKSETAEKSVQDSKAPSYQSQIMDAVGWSLASNGIYLVSVASKVREDLQAAAVALADNESYAIAVNYFAEKSQEILKTEALHPYMLQMRKQFFDYVSKSTINAGASVLASYVPAPVATGAQMLYNSGLLQGYLAVQANKSEEEKVKEKRDLTKQLEELRANNMKLEQERLRRLQISESQAEPTVGSEEKP